jgi:hypothetical protein
MKPAPALTRRFRTVTVNPLGAPSSAALSEKEYCVFAMQTGSPPKPSCVSFAACCFA